MKTRNYGIDFLSNDFYDYDRHAPHSGAWRYFTFCFFLSVHYQIAWLLEVIAFGAVNTYAMISGFVSVDSHFKISNILILWLQVLFLWNPDQHRFLFFCFRKAEIHPAGYRHSFRSPEKNTGILLLMQGVFSLPIHQSDVSESLRKANKNFILFLLLSYFLWFRPFHRLFTPQQDVFIWATGYSVFCPPLMYLRCVHQKTESGLSL